MYSLDINFLNDREVAAEIGEQQPVEDRKFLVYGGVAALVFLAIAGGGYFYVSRQIAEVEAELVALTAQETALNQQLSAIATSEQEVAAINARTDTVIDLFIADLPASALMQEVRVLTTPVNVQIEKFSQDENVINIDGLASSYDDVNDFLLLLQSSPYFSPTETRLVSAELEASTSKELPDLIKYEIDIGITDDNVLTLLPELQRSGAEGVVQRISLLREQGVIQQ